MKVSVVTAVLNGRDGIADTLCSVASQDYADIEHVIVDGGSTDGTLDIVRSCPSRVSHVLSGRDQGVYDALNKGLSVCTGDVVLFLHSGDVYSGTDSLRLLVEPFSDPTVAVTFGDIAITDPRDRDRVLRLYGAARFRPEALHRGLMPPHPTLAVRRRVYDTYGGYDATYKIAGDFDFCIRVLLKARASYRYVPRVLVRMPAGGLSNRGWRSLWVNTCEMKRACDSNGLASGWLALASRLPVKWIDGRFTA